MYIFKGALKLKKINCYRIHKTYAFFIIIQLLLIQFNFSQSSQNYFNPKNKNKEIASTIDLNFQNYLVLIDKYQEFQKELTDSLNYYNKIKKKEYVLNGEDINNLNTTFTDRIALLNESMAFTKLEDGFNENTEFYSLIATHLKIKSLEIYMLQQQIVGGNPKINNLINEENKLYRKEKKSLKKIKKIIISKKFRKSLVNSWNTSQNTNSANTQFKNNIIETNIASSAYYKNYLATNKKIKKSKKYFRKLIEEESSFYTELSFTNFINSILSGGSALFCNFIGIFSTRKGKLLNNKKFINSTLQQLQPLDIVLEKTPFKLTDKLIPGYWGHAAIYIGNEAQLKELGVWNTFFVSKYHKQIKEGKFIIEALRSKVACNTIHKFSNIDDYIHLRLIKEPTLKKKREMIIRVFAQIGKKYDFGYNIESSKKMICSELHYITFDEVDFKTSKLMGVNSLSVDQIAEQGLKGGAFTPIDLYIDGVRIESDKISEIYEQLPMVSNKVSTIPKQQLQYK